MQNDEKTMQMVLDLLHNLMPSISENYRQTSAIGSLIHAQRAMQDLKTVAKTVESTDSLMVIGHLFVN